MNDPVEVVAHAAAGTLAPEHGPALPVEVEVALHSRGSAPGRDQYVDPVSIGALIVSVATLAWTVYTDLRKRTPQPSPEVVARTIRVELRDSGGLDQPARDRLIEIVVNETVRAAHTDAGQGQPDPST